MKKLFVLLLFLFSFSFFAEEESAPYWSNDFRKTRLRAKETGKNLFLLFTISDGNQNNRRAIQLFRYTPAFLKEAGKDFCFLHIDAPRHKKLSWDLTAQNRRLRNRFGVSYYPTIVIVSPSSPWGGHLYTHIGLPSSWQSLLQEIRKKVRKPKAPPRKVVYEKNKAQSHLPKKELK